MNEPVLIGPEALVRLTPYPALARELEARFAARAAVTSPQRHHHAPNGGSDALLIMPAWGERHMVVKLVTAYPSNPDRGLPTIAGGLVALFDRATGELRATLDGLVLTARRTAALAAAASCRLMRADAQRLVVIGTGTLAPEIALAHAALHPFKDVVVHGRDRAKAEAVVRTLRRDGLPARAAADLADEIRQADVIAAATSSSEVVIAADAVQPGTHLTLVGAFTPTMTELDPALLPRASLYADTLEGVLEKGGEVVQAIRSGLITAERIRGDYRTLAAAGASSRRSETEITVFKSVGFAALDLIAAEFAFDRLSAEPVAG